MAEVKEEHNITIAPVPATKDGTVSVEVTKLAPWFEVNWNRQKLTHGITAIPSGLLIIEIPVEGVLPGEPITPDQLAILLTSLMSTVLPTCNVFIEAVQNEFGHKDEKEEEDW